MKPVLIYVLGLFAAASLACAYNFPAPTSNAAADTANLNTLISAMQYSTSTETIYFQPGTYLFNLDPYSGQFGAFVGTKNKLFLGSDQGTELRWLIPTTTGGPSQRGDRVAAHSFWWFPYGAENIEIRNLQFSTDLPDLDSNHPAYDAQPDGAHLKINGKNVQVRYCMFSKAPSFCVSVGPDADSTLIEYCYIFNTQADGIHESGGLGTTISQNLVDGTGDDGIGIFGDSVLPFAVTVHDNTILNTHSRGIAIGSSWFLDVRRNTIEYTAREGIYVNTTSGADVSVSTSYPAYTPHASRPYSVILDQNEVRYSGFTVLNLTSGTYLNDVSGIRLSNADYVTAGFNTVEHVKAYGIFCGNWLFTGNIGPAYLVSDTGLGGIYSGQTLDTGNNVFTTIW